MPGVTNDELASDDHVGHVGGPTGEDDAVEEPRGGHSGQPDGVGADGHEVGEGPGANRAAGYRADRGSGTCAATRISATTGT